MVQENERLTRVGPGTPMGELLRRYWQPMSTAVELDDNPVKPVKLLGESLVLYRDRQGRFWAVHRDLRQGRRALDPQRSAHL
jgi:5,5'-dehydrodivanillate O-demethylase